MGNRSTSEYEGDSHLRTGTNVVRSSTEDFNGIWDVQLAWYQKLILWILGQGVVPRRVALVPDGNRRYAKCSGIGLRSAYAVMFQKTALLCQYMVELGVEDISNGILSIRNFSRHSSEVDAVLSPMVQFYRTTLGSLASLKRMNLCVSTVGAVELHPPELQSDMAQVQVATANESRKRKCLLFTAYTSRSELTKVIAHVANAVRTGLVRSEDITAELVHDLLTITEAPETQLWFRSTGRQCFVEFVVLQSGYSYMHIEPQLWPSIGLWRLVRAILGFQIHWPYIKAVKERHQKMNSSSHDMDPQKIIRHRMFLRRMKLWRITYIERFCSSRCIQKNVCCAKNDV